MMMNEQILKYQKRTLETYDRNWSAYCATFGSWGFIFLSFLLGWLMIYKYYYPKRIISLM